jgi:hypothetical protein
MKNWYIKALRAEKEYLDTLGKTVNPEIKNGSKTVYPKESIQQNSFLSSPFDSIVKIKS